MFQQAFKDSEASRKAWLKRRQAKTPPAEAPKGPTKAAPAKKTKGTAIDPNTVFYHYGKHTDTATLQPLTFFASHRPSAESYVANGKGQLHAATLDIKHAADDATVKKVAQAMGFDAKSYLSMDDSEVSGYEYLSPHVDPSLAKAVMIRLKQLGYDGAHFKEDFDLGGSLIPGGSVAIFSSDQVKPKKVEQKAKKSEFAVVFKTNPYHDKSGRFTSADKAVHQLGQVKDKLAQLALLKVHGLDPLKSKGHIDTIATNYLKYLKNVGGSGASLDHLANMEGLNADAVKKIKGVMAAKKAVATGMQKKAISALHSQEMVQLAADVASGDKKAQAKYEMKIGALKDQFISNGGTPEDWTSHADTFAQKLGDHLVANPLKSSAPAPSVYDQAKDLYKEPAAAPAGPPPKPANWHSMGPGQKAAWTKKYGKGATGLINSGTTMAPKKPAAPAVPLPDLAELYGKDGQQWSEPSSLDTAKIKNKMLGTNYYLQREKLGKDHPEVQALYAEWQKSKDWLQEHAGLSKSEIGNLSSEQKNAANSIVAAEKAKYGSAKAALENALKLQAKTGSASGSVEALKQKAKDLGMSDAEITALENSVQSLHQAEQAKAKAEFPAKLRAVAYEVAMAKDTPHHDAAAAKLKAMKEQIDAMGLNPTDASALVSKGVAKALADKKKQADLKAQLGEKVGNVVEYFDKKFSSVPGIEKMHKHNGSSAKATLTPLQQAYFDHHQEQIKQMTEAEAGAYESFLGGGYEGQNKGTANIKAKLTTKALNKMTLGGDVTVRRNMAQKWLWESLGLNHWESGLSSADLQSAIGKTYKEKSIMSTTKSLDNAFTLSQTAMNSGIASLIIRAHKEIRGLDATIARGSSKSENEITMAPGLTMVIRKIEQGGSGSSNVKYTVHVDAIMTDNPLL